MSNLYITGAQLREMVLGGAALLEKQREEIDALNVFPVPDGDTGTNMCMTMQSAVRELSKLSDKPTASEVADAMSMGALRGARGNSGVILSQLFRGFSKALKGAKNMDAALLSDALTRGADAGYRAVMHPKEGTILTVARSIAKSVASEYEKGANVYKLIDTIIESGEKALAKTPQQLPVLKEAGVVDSGGKGLLTVYHGFKMVLDGEDIQNYQGEIMQAAMLPKEDAKPEEKITYGYCTEFFIIHLNEAFREEELEKFRNHLTHIGDSVVVAYDSDMVKVHVHTDAPGKVLQLALRFGELDKLKIENMREQNRELQKKRKDSQKEYAIISISVGEGLDELFRQLGVEYIVPGGQTMNPSIDSIAKAIYEVNAKNVFILPNNSNIILAAEQAAKISESNVFVVHCKTIPQGISAAMAFNPSAGFEENCTGMKAAVSAVVSGSVTYAVRKANFSGKQIEKGDILGMMDNELTTVGDGVRKVAEDLLGKMVEKKGSADGNILCFYGSDVSPKEAEAFGEAMQKKYPDAECIVQNGGQSLYYYYLSVE